jgi:hypothetical protein
LRQSRSVWTIELEPLGDERAHAVEVVLVGVVGDDDHDDHGYGG